MCGGGRGDKRGLNGGGRERRWGSRVTRPDAELAQNVVKKKREKKLVLGSVGKCFLFCFFKSN